MTDEDDTHGGIFWVRADDGSSVSATPGEACDEIKRLRAENARLREALLNAQGPMYVEFVRHLPVFRCEEEP
jgi:hypothetical protein